MLEGHRRGRATGVCLVQELSAEALLAVVDRVREILETVLFTIHLG
jgi:hypothetical protein